MIFEGIWVAQHITFQFYISDGTVGLESESFKLQISIYYISWIVNFYHS